MKKTDQRTDRQGGQSLSALQRAVGFLARREHSRKELYYKLEKRGYEDADIDAALLRLAQKGLQSEERFAEAFVQSRVQRGQGPVKISAELRRRGIADEWISRLARSEEYDWFELANASYLKKYGDSRPIDYQDKAQRLRFLQQRGFDVAQCHQTLERNT